MYQIESLLFFFTFYSFIGWIIEGLFNLFTVRSFLRANFLMSPIKPMYGFAATMLIILKDRLMLSIFILAALILPTLIEYITAWLMSYYFKTKYWDYSKVPFNYKGYICLKFSIYWSLLSLLLILVIHPAIYILYSLAASTWHLITPLIVFYMILDFILTTLYMHGKHKHPLF
ncbi:putative ABC transporter permease [Cellulosilyticum sp. I15G10I2]|uniref:putative ABC transporter permease n=1 Tax=Cellulosilyticum sp. I15G10I2 TaxID=1892843 RepID=UPI00085BD142|nr:putative ABC transporter permease [Cellulosilyticum sp. I15G10I2]